MIGRLLLILACQHLNNNNLFILAMRIIIMVETGSNDEMKDILKELRKKMNEIDEMTEDLEEKRSELLKTTPKKTAKLLEEIKVPALSLLK